MVVNGLKMAAVAMLQAKSGSKHAVNSQKISEKPQIFNFLFRFFLKKLIFRSFCWILTKKGKKGIFWHFLPHFFSFRSIFGNFKTSNWVFLPKFSIVTVVAIVTIVATIGSRLSHCRNNIFDDNMIKCKCLRK